MIHDLYKYSFFYQLFCSICRISSINCLIRKLDISSIQVLHYALDVEGPWAKQQHKVDKKLIKTRKQGEPMPYKEREVSRHKLTKFWWIFVDQICFGKAWRKEFPGILATRLGQQCNCIYACTILASTVLQLSIVVKRFHYVHPCQ